MAIVTYHKSHTFIDDEDVTHNFLTQLYKTGVYGILDNLPSMQGSFTPQQIKRIENK